MADPRVQQRFKNGLSTRHFRGGSDFLGYTSRALANSGTLLKGIAGNDVVASVFTSEPPGFCIYVANTIISRHLPWCMSP